MRSCETPLSDKESGLAIQDWLRSNFETGLEYGADGTKTRPALGQNAHPHDIGRAFHKGKLLRDGHIGEVVFESLQCVSRQARNLPNSPALNLGG